MTMTLAPDALLGLIDAATSKYYPDPTDDTTLIFADKEELNSFGQKINAMIYRLCDFENFDGGCFITDNSGTTGRMVLFILENEEVMTLTKDFDVVVG